MACHCSGCSRSKRIGTIRALQPEESRCLRGKSAYPSKSKKVYMDRYLAARKWLIWSIEHYQTGYEQRKKHPPKPNDRWVYWGGEALKRNDWGVRKYNVARAKCKELGLL